MKNQRRKGRELALQILFQQEFSPQIEIADLLHLFEESTDPDSRQFAEEIVQGVSSHKDEIDVLIRQASRHWKIERMSVVDRTILRIATFEIKFAGQSMAVAIDEAVEIAKKFGNTDSGAFVNGILDQISKGASS